MPFRFTQFIVAATVLLVSVFTTHSIASDPCHDSDGDGWADPEVASDSCPADNCPTLSNVSQSDCANFGDPVYDGTIDVLDVVKTIDYAFGGQMPIVGAPCSSVLLGGTDVNCDSATDVVDVVKVINVAFRGLPDDFCKPCVCDCYPSSCPELEGITNLLPNNGSFERLCDSSRAGWNIPAYESHPKLVPSLCPGGGQWALMLYDCWVCNDEASTLVQDIVPGGIYRLVFYTRGPYGGAYGSYVMRYGQHVRSGPATGSITWSRTTVIDTLPATSGALSIIFYGEEGQVALRLMIDRVSLEYLGQP